MRKAVCCFFFLSAALVAQTPSNNAAADALKKRLLSLNLLNPPAAPKPIVLAGPVTKPKVCAIPLLRAIPPGTRDAMGIARPKAGNRGDTVQVPAPACGETR